MAAPDGSSTSGSGGTSGAGTPGEAARLPYEQARDELAELVRRLEAGGLTLAESLALWERGEELAAVCEEWLEGARARLAGTGQRNRAEPGQDPRAPF